MPRVNPHRSTARDKAIHSRKGRGVAGMATKKGGAGAHSWGTYEDDMEYDDAEYIDQHDPNYDPDEHPEDPPVPSKDVSLKAAIKAVERAPTPPPEPKISLVPVEFKES